MEKKILEKYPKLGSSVNPNAISLTLKALIPLIVSVALLFGVNIDSTELDTYVTSLGTLISSAVFIYGGVRKLVNFVKSRKNKNLSP
jgi:hypothetical protein